MDSYKYKRGATALNIGSLIHSYYQYQPLITKINSCT